MCVCVCIYILYLCIDHNYCQRNSRILSIRASLFCIIIIIFVFGRQTSNKFSNKEYLLLMSLCTTKRTQKVIEQTPPVLVIRKNFYLVNSIRHICNNVNNSSFTSPICGCYIKHYTEISRYTNTWNQKRTQKEGGNSDSNSTHIFIFIV